MKKYEKLVLLSTIFFILYGLFSTYSANLAQSDNFGLIQQNIQLSRSLLLQNQINWDYLNCMNQGFKGVSCDSYANSTAQLYKENANNYVSFVNSLNVTITNNNHLINISDSLSLLFLVLGLIFVAVSFSIKD